MFKRLIVHPFLFAIFPVLFLYNKNAYEMHPVDVLFPALLALLSAAFLFLIYRVVCSSWPKAALLSSVSMLIFYSYGQLVRYFDSHTIPLALVVLMAVTAYRLIKIESTQFKIITRLLNILSLIVLVVQLTYGAFVLTGRTTVDRAENLDTNGKLTTVSNRPDIYLIILDGYASQELLLEKFKYDNSSFTNALKQRGFIVSRQARSNYSQTLPSLVSMMDMNYIDQLGMFDPTSGDRVALARLLERSKVGSTLAALGYLTAAFATGYDLTSLESADRYFVPGFTLSEFHNTIIATTPLPYLLGRVKSLYDFRRDRISFILDKLPTISPGDRPQFVFAHVISPHPPFVFDSVGNEIAPSREFGQGDGSHYIEQGGTREEYQSGYINQLSYISKRVLKIVGEILDNYGNTPPVIILMGDHGPGSSLDWEKIEKTDLDERFSILNAVYLPGADSDSVNWNSPVNNFRTVFNFCFGSSHELLPERNYFSTWSQPYNFIDISDSLHSIDSITTNSNP